ncbi:MAG: hypothetical protein A2081_04805 [Elusimicrobia bacterium GWC2_61_19]|nr:MAG: hypothetical protein A2081_04805 [Elusimicrobia bacterium GWC2_61_19]
MLRNINSLLSHRIHATDGEIGKVDEFFFDDKTWHIRYMVAATGGWLSGRKVLISPAALKMPDWKAGTLPVSLTRKQVADSPDIDTQKTVTRQHELELHKHYAWPLYWGDGFYAGSMSGGMLFPPTEEREEKPAPERPPKRTHLQSTRAVTGYKLHAADGPIGHVEDYIIDDGEWAIRYLVARTGEWLPGRKVLVSPHWIERVDWETAEVFVDLTREAIKESPPFNPAQPVSADYESELYDHYGRPKFEVAANRAAAAQSEEKR